MFFYPKPSRISFLSVDTVRLGLKSDDGQQSVDENKSVGLNSFVEEA